MTEPPGMESVEYIEIDGLKICFRRNRGGTGIPLVLTSPWPESLYAYNRSGRASVPKLLLSQSTFQGLGNRKAGRN